MSETSGAEYERLSPRYPKDRDVHLVKFDGRSYYFKSINGEGHVRLDYYLNANGEEVPRLDTFEADDVASPVRSALNSNGLRISNQL